MNQGNVSFMWHLPHRARGLMQSRAFLRMVLGGTSSQREDLLIAVFLRELLTGTCFDAWIFVRNRSDARSLLDRLEERLRCLDCSFHSSPWTLSWGSSTRRRVIRVRTINQHSFRRIQGKKLIWIYAIERWTSSLMDLLLGFIVSHLNLQWLLAADSSALGPDLRSSWDALLRLSGSYFLLLPHFGDIPELNGDLGGLSPQKGRIADFFFTKLQQRDFLGPLPFEKLLWGMDFGFRHASVLLACFWEASHLWVLVELYAQGWTHEDWTQRLRYFLPKETIVWADSAEPARIASLRHAGLDVRPVRKKPGDRLLASRFFRELPLYIDVQRCPISARELRDLRQGKYSHEWAGRDDIFAALRYATRALWAKPDEQKQNFDEILS